MFDSIFSSPATVGQVFLMLGIAVAVGLLTAFLLSLRMKANPRFYIVVALIPSIVGVIVSLTNNVISTGVAVAVAGAFGLVRFRSAQGSSEEIIAILLSMAAGLAYGAGYVAYGSIFMVGVALLYLGFTFLPIFEHTPKNEEKVLRITVPEDLNYSSAFDATFDHYVSSRKLLRTKTTNMGSLFKLTYRVKMRNPLEEKAFIDELRTKNGNLEIMLEPYSEFAEGL